MSLRDRALFCAEHLRKSVIATVCGFLQAFNANKKNKEVYGCRLRSLMPQWGLERPLR